MKTVNKPDISVIIPIYNSEDSILRCLSSVQDQTFNNIEIICIDDCSSDNSNRILKELALKDERIILLENEKNVGPGVSRNKGIDIARGDYLIFIDADDYVDKDLLEALYGKANSGYFDLVNGVKKYICKNKDIIVINKRHNIEKGISDGKPLWYLFYDNHHGVLYKKRLFDDKQIRYGTTYLSEDSLFLLKVGYKTNSIGFLKDDGPYYYRVQTQGSLTDSYANKDKIDQIIRAFHERMEYIKSEAYTDIAIDYYIGKLFYLLSIHRYLCSYETDLELSDYYLKKLKRETMYFPSIELIKKKNYTVKALADYGFNLYMSSNLAPRSIQDITYFENGVKEWVRFSQEHPELKKEWKMELINVLSKKSLIENNIIRIIEDKNAIDDYSIFLDNELKGCTSLTEFEKSVTRVLSYLRHNKKINRILSIIRVILNKNIK